jgi:hypothetical protein
LANKLIVLEEMLKNELQKLFVLNIFADKKFYPFILFGCILAVLFRKTVFTDERVLAPRILCE